MPQRTYSAYSKKNCGWPLQRDQLGWKLGELYDRAGSAVYHLARTPKGSFYADPEYGNNLSRIRSQGMTQANVDLARAELNMGFRKYLPDLSLVEMTIIRAPNEQKLTIEVMWALRGTTAATAGNVKSPSSSSKTTTVSI